MQSFLSYLNTLSLSYGYYYRFIINFVLNETIWFHDIDQSRYIDISRAIFFERDNTQSINQSISMLKNIPTEWYIIEWEVKQSTLSSRSSSVLYQVLEIYTNHLHTARYNDVVPRMITLPWRVKVSPFLFGRHHSRCVDGHHWGLCSQLRWWSGNRSYIHTKPNRRLVYCFGGLVPRNTARAR